MKIRAGRILRLIRRVMLAGLALGAVAFIAFGIAVLGWEYPVEELSPDRRRGDRRNH